MDGPKIYSTLVDEVSGDIENECLSMIEFLTKDIKENISVWVSRRIQVAYAAGVRDGFQQGVAAECKKRGD